MAKRQFWGTRLLLAIALLSAGIWLGGEAWAQAVVDEARQAGRSAQSFPAADEDYFRAMDGGIALSPDEVKGRNVEVMWLTGRLFPDHKTIAGSRKDNGLTIRQVCSRFVVLCRTMGLFAEAGVAIDGSKFKAVNNRDRIFRNKRSRFIEGWVCDLPLSERLN
jgi:hypothetical protein